MRGLGIGFLLPMLGLCLAGCGDSSSEQKEIALKQPQFSQPLILHVDRDGYSAAKTIASWSGVNSQHFAMPTHIEFGVYPLCINSLVRDLRNSLAELTHDAKLGSYSFEGGTVTSGSPLDRTRTAVRGDIGNQQQGSGQSDPGLLYWMINHQILDAKQIDVTYSDILGTVQNVSWYCTYVNEHFARARTAGGTTDFHNGVDLIVGKREAVDWSYANTYETDLPGKGRVKIFAGMFAYRINPTMSDLSFKEDGKGAVKMFLDPDTGQWTIVSFNLSDPSVTLQNADAPKTVFTKEDVEAVDSFGSQIDVSLDGTTRVVERISVSSAGKQIRHGIFRRLPNRYRNSMSSAPDIVYKIEDVSMDGRRIPFTVARNGETELVKIGDQNTLVSKGRHSYSLAYVTRLPMSVGNEAYVFDWSATGTAWSMPIRHAYANVNVPVNAQITKSVAVVANEIAVSRRAVSTFGPSSASFSSAGPLVPGQQFLISLAFSKTTDALVHLPVLFEQLRNPAYQAAFSALFGSRPPEPWLGHGTASDGRVVTIAGTQYEYYVECKPHDCAENGDHVLFTRDGSRAWALLTSGDGMQYFGEPTSEVGAFLRERVCNERKMWGGTC